MTARPYNFAYLDEQTKRMIRRAILKAVAIPGYQVPFASREMPMPYGWGTGGVQVTAAVLGPDDVLKVIDQGADDTTNAVSIRAFFAKTAGVATTTSTEAATIIQTRHRVPEAPLTDKQILVYQVPIPEPLRFLEPRETETRVMHALGEYGVMHVKLYEDIARHGHIATTYAYPARVADRYIMDPSPIPKFDNPKLDDCPALQLFGAGREKRIYAIPPYTKVVSLDFEDHPFERTKFDARMRVLRRDGIVPRRGRDRRQGRADVRLLGHGLLREAARRRRRRREVPLSRSRGEGRAGGRVAPSRRPPPRPALRASFSRKGGGREPRHDPPPLRAQPEQTLRRDPGLQRHFVRAARGRGARGGRRIRLGQDHAAASHRRPAWRPTRARSAIAAATARRANSPRSRNPSAAR